MCDDPKVCPPSWYDELQQQFAYGVQNGLYRDILENNVKLWQKDQTIKQDADKLRWGLLFGPLQEALAEVVKVLAEGEKKYGQGNTWKDVTPQRYLEAASRHLMELHSKGVGQVNSQDGNVYHCAQAIVDLLFALQNTLAAEKVKEK